MIIDTGDLDSGQVLQVIASGDAEVVTMGPDRAVRKLERYLASDPVRWPERFPAVLTDPEARLGRMIPRRPLHVLDQSFA